MPEEKIPFGNVVKSVLAAFFGVQSSSAHRRDFEKGNVAHFIFVGLILTALFVLTVWGVVQLILYVVAF